MAEEQRATTSKPVFELYTLDSEMTRDEVIDGLAATPSRLREILGAADVAAIERRGEDGGWSAIEVLRHVRDVIQVYGMRFKWMILDEEPFLPNYDEDRWAAQHPDGTAAIGAMLSEIAAYRAETVRLLRALPDAGWSRRGRHPVLGVVELEPYVRHQLAHELQHIEQLRAALR
jgi:hypothetical protein